MCRRIRAAPILFHHVENDVHFQQVVRVVHVEIRLPPQPRQNGAPEESADVVRQAYGFVAWAFCCADARSFKKGPMETSIAVSMSFWTKARSYSNSCASGSSHRPG